MTRNEIIARAPVRLGPNSNVSTGTNTTTSTNTNTNKNTY